MVESFMINILFFIVGWLICNFFLRNTIDKKEIKEVSFLGKKEELKKGRVVFHDDEDMYYKEQEKNMEQK